MTFKAPSRMIKKVLGFKSMKHKNGNFLLWNIPCSIVPIFAFSYIQRLLEKKYNKREAATILYSLGVLQTKVGFDLISDRFGYAKTYKNKVELLKFITEQAATVGNGSYKWTRIDLKNKLFIVRSKCPHCKSYRRFFGMQKNPVNPFIRGECATMIKKAFEIDNCFCIEKRCVATGDKFCEFVVRPFKDFNKKDNLVKNQLIDNILSFKELNAKIHPNLVFG